MPAAGFEGLLDEDSTVALPPSEIPGTVGAGGLLVGSLGRTPAGMGTPSGKPRLRPTPTAEVAPASDADAAAAALRAAAWRRASACFSCSSLERLSARKPWPSKRPVNRIAWLAMGALPVSLPRCRAGSSCVRLSDVSACSLALTTSSVAASAALRWGNAASAAASFSHPGSRALSASSTSGSTFVRRISGTRSISSLRTGIAVVSEKEAWMEVLKL